MNLKALIHARTCIASYLLQWIPDLVIAGCLPGRIGQHLVVDTLISWSEKDAAI